MLVKIRRCPNCPLLQAYAAGLASALRAGLGADVLLTDGKPTEFSVSLDGEAVADRKEGLPSIHDIVVAVSSRVPVKRQKIAQTTEGSRPRRAAASSCRLPGVYHYAGRECVAGINLLPPSWFQTRLIRVPVGNVPTIPRHRLVGEPCADILHEAFTAIDGAAPVGEGGTAPNRPDFGGDERNARPSLRGSQPAQVGS
jgi:hypothetical protein